MSAVALRELGATSGESSSIRGRVESARGVQRARYERFGDSALNATVSGRVLLKQLAPEARTLLDSAAESLSLSARAYHRVVKVARTIADLAGAEAIDAEHLAEALRYRPPPSAAVSSRRSAVQS